MKVINIYTSGVETGEHRHDITIQGTSEEAKSVAAKLTTFIEEKYSQAAELLVSDMGGETHLIQVMGHANAPITEGQLLDVMGDT
ncbi:MAG: hypothetical protein QGG36_03280 [Pirellulaceae bacterium]|jgi:hypothetical protein|nr:hypothetical protein [Pirellulaceae bacterium]